jgi:hypothetical protein
MAEMDRKRANLEDRVRLLTAAIDDIRRRQDQVAASGRRPPIEDRRALVRDRLMFAHRRLAALRQKYERELVNFA